MKRTSSAGGVVLDEQGRVLVVSQHGDSWSLPKGHLEPGEGPLEAARREILEEAGIDDLSLVGELGSYERHRIGRHGAGEDAGELKTIHLFLFRTRQRALRPQDPANPEARWLPIHAVEEILTHPKDKEFFRSIRPRLEVLER